MKTFLKLFFGLIPLLFSCFFISANPYFKTQIIKNDSLENPAQPQGGINPLLQFINNNLRLPLSAKINNTFGQVIIEADIQVNGSVRNIRVTKSLSNDCDQEAIRVLSLFKAWQPACVQGETVKQKVVIPIDFKKEDSYLEYFQNKVITYLDAQFQKTNSKTNAIYYSIIPLGANGIPMGDKQFYIIGNDPKPFMVYKYASFNITREPVYGGITADTLKLCNQVCFRSKNGKLEGDVYKYYTNGTLFEHETFKNGRIVGTSKKYYPNGMLGEEKIFVENSTTDFEYFRWHPNGQIAEISFYSLDADDNFKMSYTFYNLWDTKGKLLVKEGNGEAEIKKYSPTFDALVERGIITQGVKNGLWEGFINDKLTLQETYDLGTIATAGYVDELGRLREYKHRLVPPQYKKGDDQVANFIIQRLKSDIDLEEKIHITFIVQPDGTISEIALESLKKNRSFEQDVLNIFKQTNGSWKPAMYLGKPISAKHEIMLNISFR